MPRPPYPSVMRHLRLLEAPSPWLSQLVKAAGPVAKLALFQTCRPLRDVVLANSSHIRLSLSPSQDPAGKAAARCLQLLGNCREGTDVELTIEAVSLEQGGEDNDVAVITTAWLSTFCTGTTTLHHIKSLDIQGILLGDLLPAALISACTNLQRLTRAGRFPSNPEADFNPQPFPQLRTLTLRNIPPDAGGISTQDLKEQLQALTHLQELHLESTWAEDVDDGWDEPEVGSFWADTFTPLRSRLVTLRLLDSMLLLPLFHAPWPLLQRLDMATVWLGHEHVDHLLRYAPHLQELKVQAFHFAGGNQVLPPDYSHRQCQWQHLVVQDIITTQHLASLPLSNLQSLRFKSIEARQYDVSQLEVATRHLKACQDIGKLRAGGPLHVLFGLPLTWEQPLLPSVVELLQALGNQPLRVGIPSHMLLDASSALLFEQLPQLQLLECDPQNAAGAAVDFIHLLLRLKDMCVRAKAPVALRVTASLARHLEPNWEAQLCGAMQAAGHQHVSIDVMHPFVRCSW